MFEPTLLEKVRSDTPVCSNLIHLHNCGASLMPSAVVDAVKAHIDLESQIGGYEAEDLASDRINLFYTSAATMLGCQESEIAFMENATAAWNAVFYGFARSLNPGEKILTAKAEYASNFIAYLHVARLTGCEVSVVPDDENGQLDAKALESMIDSKTKLISITHVPTSGGLVNPAQQVGQIARRFRIPYLLDACQSVGQLNVNVDAIGCDALSFTGRKFLRGPRGTGGLYINKDSMDIFPPMTLDLHSAKWDSLSSYQVSGGAKRYENWENNVAGLIGLGVAIDYANSIGFDRIEQRVLCLAGQLREKLASLDRVDVLDLGLMKSGIVSFSLHHKTAAELCMFLGAKKVQIGVSGIGSTRLDFESRQLKSINRAAVHYFNTEAELDILCEAIIEFCNT